MSIIPSKMTLMKTNVQSTFSTNVLLCIFPCLHLCISVFCLESFVRLRPRCFRHRTLNSFNDLLNGPIHSTYTKYYSTIGARASAANLPGPKLTKSTKTYTQTHKNEFLAVTEKQTNKWILFQSNLIGSKQWTMQTSGKPTTTTGL